MRLILASASPRRAELLRSAGYTFDVVVANVDESIRPGESPSVYVRRLAADKSAAARSDGHTGPPGDTAQHLRDDVALPLELHIGVDPRVGPDERNGPPAEDSNGRVGPDVVVLGADTTVVVDGEILGKPRDDEEGRDMLRRLSGRAHEVLTGVSLRRGAIEAGRVEVTSVVFRNLTEEDVAWYVASGEGRDKAGGYAIQGLASRFIPSISGSYSNVVGLPVACVEELLRSVLASGL
jgi:septum formation protein